MADRQLPEDENPVSLPTKFPAKRNGFLPQDKLTNLKNTATARRLRARVTQAKNGTPHEQHVAHEEHMQHMRNVSNKNMKSKNPYNT